MISVSEGFRKISDLARDRANWPLLQRIANSFLSKIMTGTSFAVLILSNLKSMHLQQFFNTGSFQLTITGGLFFLVGYILVTIFIPPEFRASGSLNEVVMNMKNIEFVEFFNNRREMLSNLVNRIKSAPPFDMSGDPIKIAQITLDRCKNIKATDWKDYSASLYLADLNLRQHDKPRTRMLAAGCLFIGIELATYSTIAGAAKIVYHWFA